MKLTPKEIKLLLACRLLNRGPTPLVSTQHGYQRNVMATVWNMPLNSDPF